MSKFDKRISEVEQNIMKERVTRPITWRLGDPYIDKVSGDVAVNVVYFIHNGAKGGKGDEGQMEFMFDKDEFSPTLRAVDKLDGTPRINEIRKISAMRDAQFQALNAILCNSYDDNIKTERLEIYRDVHDLLFMDDEYRERFRSLVKVETLMNLLRRPSVFYSEELRELFA